ncbi:MAG TPA: hypothetical protein VHW43_01125, partial [Puia sp.]|nr:hypothetical protein [Puia sp.]
MCVDRLLDTVAILLMVIISYVWNKRKYFVGWMIAFVISAALGLFLTVRYSDFVEEHVCEENQTLTGGQSFKP